MSLNLKVDKWGCAILCCPAENFLPLPENKKQSSYKFIRLPEIGKYRFIADPFAIWENNLLYVFVEAYDYRNRRGRIDLFVYDRELNLVEEVRPVFRTNFHLSYPYVFKDKGEFYMLPEGWKSGKLTLYRAQNFPYDWEPVPEFQFPEIGAIDATPFVFEGKWWMFWSHPDPKDRREFDLHLSCAEDLLGKWEYLGLVRQDDKGCRAGGRPILRDGRIFLPAQRAVGTYGSGLYFLEVQNLSSKKPTFIEHPDIKLPAEITQPYPVGFHTLSSAGDVTLIDYKRLISGPGSLITRLLSKINPFHKAF
ncbi:hypothetical protein FAI41_03435 [Acetobacteraceae bacterium]|nr:hypothetical protein FAI41_03435 [Acetobacteraceae bacterium]